MRAHEHVHIVSVMHDTYGNPVGGRRIITLLKTDIITYIRSTIKVLADILFKLNPDNIYYTTVQSGPYHDDH